MNAPKNFPANGEIGATPDLIRSEEQSGVPLLWLFLFATFGFMLYESLQSFLSTGRIWPVIFISLLFLLLVDSCLEMKQRKH
ncbi:MAG: hypothetical protein H0X43_08600 [Nitrosospira sp.]|nr:hypothetical protein [Nitrosospira sp.]